MRRRRLHRLRGSEDEEKKKKQGIEVVVGVLFENGERA